MKICFIGQEHHRRTGSARFMVDLLRTIGDVTELYGEPEGTPDANESLIRQVASSRFDRYVYWRSELILERVLPMDLGPSFLAPTHDTLGRMRDEWWLRFINCHFLSFTRAHHERLRAMGSVSSHFQYFPDPGPGRERRYDGEPDAFFWQRQPRGTINLATVLRQCHALGITRLHVHNAPDRAEDSEALPIAGHGATDITLSHEFAPQDVYRAQAGKPLFFFAPRPREGIGTACLEAMADGQIVVAPDLPVINEYVAHLGSGLLYGLEAGDAALPPVDAAGLARMGRAARRKMVEGHRIWLADTTRLLSIIAMDGRRWSMSDSSAAFGDVIRRAAHRRMNDGN